MGSLCAIQLLIDDAIGDGFVGLEPEVAVAVLVDLFDGLAGVLGHDFVHALAEAEHFLGFDGEVGGGALHDAADEGLVEHDAALGRAERLPAVPEASSQAPMEAARPRQVVATSQRRNCMVS